MMKEDGVFVSLVGFFVAIIGLYIYSRQETIWGVPTGVRPYGDIGLLTVGFGLSLIVAGGVLWAAEKPDAEETEKKVVYVSPKKCPKMWKPVFR